MTDLHTQSLDSGAETHGDRLARWAARIEWEHLPPSVRSKVIVHVLDVLGVICAGLESEFSVSVQRAIQSWGGTGESTVVGRGWRLPAPSAALANAFAARVNTYDDTYEVGPIHPGSSAVSAALAGAEAAQSSGRAFLAAVLAGYEVTTRVSAAVSPGHYDQGFHTPGTCNTFGACAAASRAFGLDPDAAVEALGLAGESAAGLRQYQISGSMADSAFHGARAAQTGVMAVQLRIAGLPGARGIIDGPLGFCSVMSSTSNPERLDRGLGEHFEFMDTSIKPFPSCRYTHLPIEAVLTLRDRHALAARSIERVTIATFGHSINVSDRPEIRSKLDAILSHQYCAALALAKGRLELADFDADRIGDREILDLARRIEIVHDESLDASFPATWPHRISIFLTDGTELQTFAEHAPGTQENPLSPSLVRDKFLGLTEPVFGARRSFAIAEAVESLEELDDVREFTALLTPEGQRSGA